MGRTGKSVARSYLAALDCLIPVQASVSGSIAMNQEKALEPRLQIIRDRYWSAMGFLKSPDEADQTRSKLSTYVRKQDSWNKAVEQYSLAQERQLSIVKQETPRVDEQRQKYFEWLQAHGRDYKASIQARYMDWVVHGYKFEIEFNFGIVDISSGMKRVESSKEAFRNLTLIAADGASEYCGVNLNPDNWASLIKSAVDNWADGPSAVEIRGEIKRLKRVLISHQALLNVVTEGTFSVEAAAGNGTEDEDAELKDAYAAVYKKMNTDDKDAAAKTDFGNLRDAQKKWAEASLESKRKANGLLGRASQKDAKTFLAERVLKIKTEIDELESKLNNLPGETSIMPSARDAEGKTIDVRETTRNQDLFRASSSSKSSRWTRVNAKVSKSSSSSVKVSKEAASSFAAKASFGLFSASGGASHVSASTNAMSAMANLDVEVSMDCMLVEIGRPWLHAELFSDHELDTTEGFPLSPGPEKLHDLVEANKAIPAPYTEFPSYPTAFVVGCNVELEFSGDTTHLESAIESSSTEANLSVGYGPFAISGSHKQSQSSSKTKAESTATGMRIKLQAPQIIGWVHELLPELPKPKDAADRLSGLALEPLTAAPLQLSAPTASVPTPASAPAA